MRSSGLDDLDVAILTALRMHPRIGVLELSRLTSVARATVQARMQRMEDLRIITGYGPDIDLESAGFPVQAFVTLEISQGALDEVQHELESIPGVLEAYATSGAGDVLCRVAARDNAGLQGILLSMNRSSAIARTTSVMILSVLVPARDIPLLAEPLD